MKNIPLTILTIFKTNGVLMCLLIKFFLTSLFITQLMGCASQEKPRTKWSDPTMRLVINPNGIDPNNYVRIQNALVSSGKWWVVDRALAFKAAIAEQNMTRVNYPERFDDTEKFARLGKLYGVGGVIQAHAQCITKEGFLKGWYAKCVVSLSLVSTNTGEVIATSEVSEETPINPYGMEPVSISWEKAVDTLNDNFPKNYEPVKWTKEMQEYKQTIKEEAVREREGL